MTQIPIINGIYVDGQSNFRTFYPVNMIPVPKQNGISDGYLRPADGIIKFGEDGPGVDRGGINWNNALYRVMGTKLVKVLIDGSITILGDVGGYGQVTMAYSFDRLAISSSGKLFYWDGITLTMVTDTDLGNVIDFSWIDGYFLPTDGEFILSSELNNPTSFNPLKYASSEADPDPIKRVLKLRNELYAVNRYTIEAFHNVGGSNFPFERIEGAQMMRGAIGTYCSCVFMEAIAFLGGGRNESPSIWLGSNGSTEKLSTRTIEQILETYSENDLARSLLETRTTIGHQFLYVHLIDQTLVYDFNASKVVGDQVWFILKTKGSRYRARNFVWCYDKWICGDPGSYNLGYLTQDLSSHYGEVNNWEVSTSIVYNESKGVLFHELELVCLSGNVDITAKPVIWTSYSLDGRNWSQEYAIPAGTTGDRNARLVWLRQGSMRNWRIQKFRGTSDSHLSLARLEARMEQLNV